MDAEAFLDMANQVIKLKMFPYFDIAHRCVVTRRFLFSSLLRVREGFSLPVAKQKNPSSLLSVYYVR